MNDIPKIFDRPRVKNHLQKQNSDQPDFVTKLVLQDLADRLKIISRPFKNALILAPNIAPLPDILNSALGPIHPSKISTLQNNKHQVDPENLTLPHTDYDLIISLFDMGFTNDVPGFLAQILSHLAPDGLFVSAFVGGTSFSELRQAWLEADAKHFGGAVSRVAPFIDIKDAGSLLQRAGFALPVIDKETLNLRYASPLNLMTEIKSLGASAPLFASAPKPVTKSHLASAIDAYTQIASDKDNRVRATLEIIWMSGWGPDENQQKPLKPGSAQISLTKICGVR